MNKPSILVVEDDVPVRCLITTTLKTHGYKYLTASNGETAIMMTTSHNPDIMLLDLGLPDIDGIEVIRSVRTWSNLPIIVLSARSEDSDKIEALDNGADDYLTKPFATKELLARVRAMTRRRENVMEPNLHFEDLELSATSFQLGCNGEWVYLANKEYQMMEMLLKNPRCVLSAEQFIEAIWGYESDVENNVVWTYISRLRRILKQLDSHTVIRTAKGIGFALEKDDD